MHRTIFRNFSALTGSFLLAWLGLKYLLPLALPFLVGAALALAAEPAVGFLEGRLRLPRTAAAGVGVTATLVLLLCVLVLLATLLVRQLGLLVNALPNLEQATQNGLSTLEGFLLNLTQNTPQAVRPLLDKTVTNLFSDSSALIDRATQRLPAITSAALGHVPDSALALGTGLLSCFMVSARLPNIRAWLHNRAPTAATEKYLSAAKRIRSALSGWLKAQLKLSGLTFLIVCLGLFLLRVPYAPVWAFFIALVDAVPVLGTGTVLIPWSLVAFIQQKQILALGLLGIYITAMLSRSFLEPRLVGKQLGLDPLMTLIALYAGYRIWGIWGMLLAPLLCVAAMELVRAFPPKP